MRKFKNILVKLGVCFALGSTLQAYASGAGTAELQNADQAITTSKTSAACPDYLNVEFRKLHSEDSVNLCSLSKGKPIVIVNTASHCGFTPQFKELEALYQRYKANGLQVVGFASNDFNQEDASEKKAAGICYKNYGVTFTMLAPTNVKGKGANLTFRYLSSKTEAPGWNFNKYLIAPDNVTVKHYGSKITPLNSELETDVKKYVF
ncbi:Glutathione peroxidase BsaA [Thalassocella blandensis]|nr:Glutathione peroxidase BsaA [Thalassocella blandensis]